MPDETGTEATRSDAPSVDESLFGDAVDDTEAAVADEQDANEETEQAPQGSDDAGEQDRQPEDLKVVVSIKGGRATIGVQRPSSDPHIETFDDGDLAGLTQTWNSRQALDDGSRNDSLTPNTERGLLLPSLVVRHRSSHDVLVLHGAADVLRQLGDSLP